MTEQADGTFEEHEAETASDATDLVWRAQGTNPGAIDDALRAMLAEAHARNANYVPARVLNLVCVVDAQWSGEIANRLRGVGRYHASRTVVCAVHPRRDSIDAVATITVPTETKDGEFVSTRETVIVDVGPRHLHHLDRVVDPLVVTDLPTVVWSPHGHPEAVDSLLALAQVVLLDSVDEPDPDEALRRAHELSDKAYVVDLAWLRSTPWRERLAATFDPPKTRADLALVSAITVRHHPESEAAAMLLVGWLASRLGWEVTRLTQRDGCLEGKCHAHRQDVAVRLEPDPELQVRGLSCVILESASGRWMSFERGPGGLRAHYRRASSRGGQVIEREWTILGASRGEAGILGEGIRQALLRDPTYGPALACAERLAG